MNIIQKPSSGQEGRKGSIPCLLVNHITGQSAMCPKSRPDKSYYPGGEVRVTEPSILGITKVVRKYTSRKGQTGDLYTVQALQEGESRLIANVAGKTSSVLVKVV